MNESSPDVRHRVSENDGLHGTSIVLLLRQCSLAMDVMDHRSRYECAKGHVRFFVLLDGIRSKT